jgi:hypothetical protein
VHSPEFSPSTGRSLRPARVSVTVLALLLASHLAACAAPGRPSTPIDSMPQPAASAALPEPLRADAAQRGRVPADQVQLISREPVTWRDGSLGCPEPDRGYTQALVPGYRIRVRAGEETLTYHADRRGRWVWCPPGRAVEPLDPAG